MSASPRSIPVSVFAEDGDDRETNSESQGCKSIVDIKRSGFAGIDVACTARSYPIAPMVIGCSPPRGEPLFPSGALEKA